MTRNIRVQVKTEPDLDRTFPDLGHWIIPTAKGNVEEVRGPGVVGYQPTLEPGQSFQYTSACPLPTPVGTMHGTYRMVTSEGESFEAEIAPFHLEQPELIN